jgi:integrase
VTPFVPHQLRHCVATRLVDEVGVEAAQRLLGHSQVAMTLHYSKAAEKQAIEAVKRLG